MLDEKMCILKKVNENQPPAKELGLPVLALNMLYKHKIIEENHHENKSSALKNFGFRVENFLMWEKYF